MKVSIEKPGTPQELVHFGVKGMKWGVRKQDDTSNRKAAKPISERKEKNAKKHEAKADLYQKRIDLINSFGPSKNGIQQNYRDNLKKDFANKRDVELKRARDIREGRLTDQQKKVLIGAGIAAAIIIAYGSYKYVDSGKLNQRKLRDIPFKKNDLLSRKMGSERLMKEVVAPINPEFGAPGTVNNCRRATFAYEMRRRGFDVTATKTLSGSGQTTSSIVNATTPDLKRPIGDMKFLRGVIEEGGKGPLTEIADTSGLGKKEIPFNWYAHGTDKTKAIFNSIAKQPEGSRGELAVEWKFGGRHSMAWEVIKGKANIIDAQSGELFSPDGFAQKMGDNVSKAGFTRLDNIDLNTEFLKRWVRNAV